MESMSENKIFKGIRKETAPPTQEHENKKKKKKADKVGRKKKHKKGFFESWSEFIKEIKLWTKKRKWKEKNELLKLGAEELENGISFPSGNFLIDNKVTIDEVYSVTNEVALIIKGFLELPEELQRTVLILGASDGAITYDFIQKSQNLDKLKELRNKIWLN